MSKRKVQPPPKPSNAVEKKINVINHAFEILVGVAPIRILFEVGAAFSLSLLFQRFTDSALWLPIDWRNIISFIIAVLAAAFAELVNLLCKHFNLKDDIRPGKGVSGDKTPAKNWADMFPPSVAIVCLIAAAILLWRSYLLRAECVFPFHPLPGWYEQQFGPKTTPVLIPETAEQKALYHSGSSTSPSTNQSETATPATGPSATAELALPDFINKEQAIFYLPEYFPKDYMYNYLVTLGHGSLRDGIVAILSNDPMQLVDWSMGAGAPWRSQTTFKFAYLHVCTLLLIAIAWGIFHPRLEVSIQTTEQMKGLLR